MPDYRVNLEVFSGPLDLLLHLIQERELDIQDIPISKITEDYLRHLEGLDVLHLVWAGEFLVLAASLLEIKSRMLLPDPEAAEAEEAEDPREGLVQRLLEFRFYKGLALRLHKFREAAARRFGRAVFEAPEEGAPQEEPILKDVGIYDLARAYAEVARQTLVDMPQRIVYDDVSVQQHIARIREKLAEKGSLSFFALFRERWDRNYVAGVFLALLEMCRLAEIRVEQPAPFGEIFIARREPEPAAAGSEDGLRKAEQPV